MPNLFPKPHQIASADTDQGRRAAALGWFRGCSRALWPRLDASAASCLLPGDDGDNLCSRAVTTLVVMACPFAIDCYRDEPPRARRGGSERSGTGGLTTSRSGPGWASCAMRSDVEPRT